MLALFRRELAALFQSAIATIFLIVFIAFSNGLFMMQFFQGAKADMRPFFYSLPLTLIIFVPALAMRLWAEDRRGNTFELLLTFPMREHQLVLGKYLASLVFYLLSLAATLTVPLMISWLAPIDPGPVAGGYLGAALTGALFLAIGIFISGLCRDQITAFVLTAVSSFLIFFLGTDLFASPIDGWISGLGTFLRDVVGAASHLASLNKGVLDIRDILYFILSIGVFLFLNGLSIHSRGGKSSRFIFPAIAAACLFSLVGANLLLHRLPAGRHDMTEGKVHTVSEVSKKILTGLSGTVEADLYISPKDKLPTPLKTLEVGITDKLEELSVVSGGKFKYRVVRPEPSTLDEPMKKELSEAGVAPFQVESIQNDEMGVKLIYSTLVMRYGEKRELLPRLMPQAVGDLEYQLLSRIQKMALKEKPIVAVYAPVETRELPAEIEKILGGEGQADEMEHEDAYKTAVVLIRNNGYEVARVALTKDNGVPEGAKLLLVLAPGVLTDEQKKQIQDYLDKGGAAVVAAQPYQFTYARGETSIEAVPAKQDLSINTLLGPWGVKISEDVLLDESSQVISLSSGQRIGPFALEMPVKLPNQILVRDEQINRKAAITRRLPSLAYLWGSALEVDEAAASSKGLKVTTLFTSSPRSWTIPLPGNLTEGNTRAPQGGVSGKFPLAVMLEGKFRLLVIGCARAFSEDLIQNPGNLNLFANIVDGLVLGDDMVSIRSKSPVLRDLKPLTAAEKTGYRFFTVLLIPIILLCSSVFWHFIRRKEKEFYLSALKSVRS